MSTYSIDHLVDRLYDELDSQEKESKSKLSLPAPEVTSANKKTFIKNFTGICSKINRKDDDVKAFFEEELKASCSIDANGMLIIQGLFRELGIKKILSNYVKSFVLCKECASGATEIIKENRITFMNCKSCLSKKAL